MKDTKYGPQREGHTGEFAGTSSARWIILKLSFFKENMNYESVSYFGRNQTLTFTLLA